MFGLTEEQRQFIHRGQSEALDSQHHPDRYTHHEVAAPRVVGSSGRTSV